MKAVLRRLVSFALVVFLPMLCIPSVADTALLPHVTEEMTDPAWWTEKKPASWQIPVDMADLKALNKAFMSAPECCMIDLTKDYPVYDGTEFQRRLAEDARKVIAAYSGGANYGMDGCLLSAEDFDGIAESIENAEASESQQVRYGVAVTLADLRALPTDMLVTDDPADLDFDVLENSAVRVNEPVVIRGQTADGSWYCCDNFCVSGWIRADRIAVCRDREEWLNAWQIPAEDVVVVTESKIFLDQANVNSASSGRMLTMGTTLRKASEAEYDPAVTNRAAFHNIAVRLPVRDAEGFYTSTIALIPERKGVSEGYLPVTTENILNVALTALGDAYGWGGMLGVPDCSGYIRNIYKCFGLEIPRNTTWQSAMPAMKRDLTGLDIDQRQAVLDELPPGTILFFRGHEMMYLGEADGLHYVISATGSIMKPGGDTVMRIRSVIINTLEETFRPNGNNWLEDLHTAVVPYLPEGYELETEVPDAA